MKRRSQSVRNRPPKEQRACTASRSQEQFRAQGMRHKEKSSQRLDRWFMVTSECDSVVPKVIHELSCSLRNPGKLHSEPGIAHVRLSPFTDDQHKSHLFFSSSVSKKPTTNRHMGLSIQSPVSSHRTCTKICGVDLWSCVKGMIIGFFFVTWCDSFLVATTRKNTVRRSKIGRFFFVYDSCRVAVKKKKLNLWRLPLLRSVDSHQVRTASTWQMMIKMSKW